MSDKISIKTVIENNFCIGCGSCCYKKNSNMKIDSNLLLTPDKIHFDLESNNICPIISNVDESALAIKRHSNIENIKYDEKLGYYLDNFAGYINNDVLREKSSSGGLTTWIIEKLFEQDLIDGVIHVGKSEDKNNTFEYKISNNIKELRENRKSRYYPTHFDLALEKIDSQKRYAFIGIPCYIKAIRLLMEKNPELKNSIIFLIGIFCGHLKSQAFSKILGWQLNIPPDELIDIDFRVKNKSGAASYYSVEASSSTKKKLSLNNKLYGTDWGLGLFKPKACDWCDDITAETADIAFGDAWLPEYVNDPLGTNILVVRHPVLLEILKTGKEQKNITLNKLDKNDIIKSQSGNYRHRREGIIARNKFYAHENLWHPQKRIFKETPPLTKIRYAIYIERYKISQSSHEIFKNNLDSGNIFRFLYQMTRQELKYRKLNKQLIKTLVKYVIYNIRILKNRIY